MQPLKIIIIEDEEAHFLLMKRAIGKEFPQASVYYFEEAADCLEKIDEICPDIVVVDYLMPTMNGIEFLEALHQQNKYIPIIMITGQGDENIAVKAMKLGAWDYLVKSADFFTLLPSTIEKVIRERELKASLNTIEKRFLDLAESTSDWIWEINVNCEFVYTNSVAERIVGYTPEEIIGQRFSNFFPKEERKAREEHFLSLLHEGKSIYNFENSFVHKNGDAIILETSAVPFKDDKGDTAGYRGISRNITRRKRSEAALRESEERFRSIYEESPIGIVLYDEEGSFTNANRAALDIFGISDITDALELRLFEDPHLPEDVVQSIYRGEMVRIEIPYDFEKVDHFHLFRTKKSGTIYIDVQITPLRKEEQITGYLLQFQDITNRKRAEEALQASHRFLEIANRDVEVPALLNQFAAEIKNLTSCTAVEIRILGDDGSTPYAVNDGFSKEFYDLKNTLPINSNQSACVGAAPGSVHAGLPFITGTDSFHMNASPSFPAAISEEEKRLARDMCNRFGYKSFALAPIRLDGSILGVIHVADPKEGMISKEMANLIEGATMVMGVAIQCARTREELRKAHGELELRVQRRTAQLALANEQLKKEIEERKKVEEALLRSSEKFKLFAYSVMHDLKSPSIGIYGLTRLLQKQYAHSLDEKGISYCRQILKASEYSSALVEKINAYIASKEAPLQIEDLSSREIFQAVRDEFSARLSARQIKWTEPDVSVRIKADRLSILRVLTNFVENALKYGGERLSEIRIDYQESDKFHILSVSDDGVGIKKEDSERIFGLFQRNATSKGVAGTGLGLAIVREIAERHHGRVWAEPNAGEGTIFHLSIAKHQDP